MIKRILSALIGIILLFVVFFWNNLVVVNIAVTIVAILGLWEFYQAFKKKGYKPFETLGYLLTLSILGVGFVESELTKIFLFFLLPILLLILFLRSIISRMKFNVIDIGITLLGIIYVSFFFSFIAFICHLDKGNYYIWYVFGGAWLTDTFAYFVGSKIGKHHFSEISPKKSIEGCIGGLIGCVIFCVAYTYYLNQIGIELNMFVMTFLGVVISFISQIGDMAASSIKRYCEIKDFGNIMPGHGGVLDRFDSVIMIAPFLYMLFQFLI